jgi:multidrug efflux pump subunit AcrA (membrane-fusion protein)
VTERILIRKDLVSSMDGTPAVWVAAFDGTASLRVVRLGRDDANGLVEVLEGLAPTDKLIVDGRGDLRAGERIVITTTVNE